WLAGRAGRHLAHRADPQDRHGERAKPAHDHGAGADPADGYGPGHRTAMDLPASVPRRQPGHVRPVRAHRPRPAPAGCAARRRGRGTAAPGRPSRPASFLPGRDVVVGGNLPAAHRGLGILMVTEPLKVFVALSTIVTVGLTAAGIGVSMLW